MKNYIINFVACLIIILGSVYLIMPNTAMAFDDSCTTTCSTDECNVSLVQDTEGWALTSSCGNGPETDSGDGQYNGTICGGVTPCQPEEA